MSFGLLTLVTVLGSRSWQEEEAPYGRLSEYGFFDAPIAGLKPAERVIPYEVNAPLFSDHAEKLRFIALPEGMKMEYRENGVFDLPVGATLIKNFYYLGEKKRQIVETRLLIRQAKGWKALTYVWNEEQTEAFLEVAGAHFSVTHTMTNGRQQTLEYTVPNVNQCKGCHSWDGAFVPIGITARQLNCGGQLDSWLKAGWLNIPENYSVETAPMLADYRKNTGGVDIKARAYLDANCGHCHNPHGPANTSGLYLHAQETDPTRLGVNKAPVAAGRGSGGRKFSIVPGKPDQSILVYRMEQNDPGIRMPEIGRNVRHEEGVSLIREWIRQME